MKVGLFTDPKQNSDFLSNQNIIYNEAADTSNILNKIVRGGQVAQGNGQKVDRELEMRISLEKKIVRVSDYPDYANVCELDDPNKIKSDIEYRFGMELLNTNSRIMITKILQVNSFDSKM